MSNADMPAAALLAELQRVNLITLFDIAACSMFLWDYLITIGMEVELVWKSQWTPMKVLYLVQRYLPFVDTLWLTVHLQLGNNMSVSDCGHILSAVCYMYVFGIAASEMILTLRTWAVWNRNRRLAIIFVITYLMVWVPDIGYMTMFLRSLKFEPPPYEGFRGCFLIDGNKVVFMCWVVVIIWDAFVLALMLISGYRAYRDGGNSALVQNVYRDGLIFYIYLFVLSGVNIIVILTLPPGYIILLASTERCLHSMLSSRVLLHIRAHVKARDEATQWSLGIQGLQSCKANVSHIY
ncbi:hypothetical protein B0H34DRAFT_737676 [Crassisporium funariophilum]|nr:hypothetical protein B0H34DRAFT_737676 [Crassisporium funariophilum]